VWWGGGGERSGDVCLFEGKRDVYSERPISDERYVAPLFGEQKFL